MLTIKCRFGQLVRRVPVVVHATEMTLDELCLLCHRLFKKQLQCAAGDLELGYVDDEGDECLLLDDADVAHAIASVATDSTLRVIVHQNNKVNVNNNANNNNNKDGVLAALCERVDALISELGALKTDLAVAMRSTQAITDNNHDNGNHTNKNNGNTSKPTKQLTSADLDALLDENSRNGHATETPVAAPSSSPAQPPSLFQPQQSAPQSQQSSQSQSQQYAPPQAHTQHNVQTQSQSQNAAQQQQQQKQQPVQPPSQMPPHTNQLQQPQPQLQQSMSPHYSQMSPYPYYPGGQFYPLPAGQGTTFQPQRPSYLHQPPPLTHSGQSSSSSLNTKPPGPAFLSMPATASTMANAPPPSPSATR